MNDIFNLSKNSAYKLRCGNCPSRSNIHSTYFGSSQLQILPLKFGIKHLTKSKKQAPVQFLKVKLKNGCHRVPLVDFAKHMWDKLVLYNELVKFLWES